MFRLRVGPNNLREGPLCLRNGIDRKIYVTLRYERSTSFWERSTSINIRYISKYKY
jgi:hypothetical protein